MTLSHDETGGERLALAKLQVRCAELEEEVRQLRDVLDAAEERLPSWLPHITKGEERVLRMLLRHSVLTHALFVASNPNVDDADALLKVFICRLRKKLAPFGIGIVNDYGRGYALDAATRSRLMVFVHAARQAA